MCNFCNWHTRGLIIVLIIMNRCEKNIWFHSVCTLCERYRMLCDGTRCIVTHFSVPCRDLQKDMPILIGIRPLMFIRTSCVLKFTADEGRRDSVYLEILRSTLFRASLLHKTNWSTDNTHTSIRLWINYKNSLLHKWNKNDLFKFRYI